MKLLLLISVISLGGCMTSKEQGNQEYIITLADRCEYINITPRGTELKCPNYREINKESNNGGSSTSTKIENK